MDIDLDTDGSVSLAGDENEVMQENWEFLCLNEQEHNFSPQMLTALQAMVEEQSMYGLDF